MNHLVSDSKSGKVFATLEEAAGFADAFFRDIGIMLAVTKTKRKVTHIFRREEHK